MYLEAKHALSAVQRQNSCLIPHAVGKREGNKQTNKQNKTFEAMSDLHNLRYFMFSVIHQAAGCVGFGFKVLNR